jgi:uncharacterized protein
VVVVGLAIATGIVGIVVPVLPGALLAWAAIAVWAVAVGGASAWAVLGVTTLAIGGAQIVKVVVPARRLRDAGVPRRSIVAGVAVAVVGFFLIPVVGFFIGFPLGVYLQERRRLGRHAFAWQSTREALRAMGLSILIELTASHRSCGGRMARGRARPVRERPSNAVAAAVAIRHSMAVACRARGESGSARRTPGSPPAQTLWRLLPRRTRPCSWWRMAAGTRTHPVSTAALGVVRGRRPHRASDGRGPRAPV